MRLYHGTDLSSAEHLLAGGELDAPVAVALKIDGPPGFFLATTRCDAEFFALRRAMGGAVIVAYDVSDEALRQLLAGGAVLRPIPVSQCSPNFAGDELFVPPSAFALFDELVRGRAITLSPG